MKIDIKDLLAPALLMLISACSQPRQPPGTANYSTFSEYQAAARRYINEHRQFQSADRARETDNNAPREWRPAGRPKGGILLVHGLGDSPWSFTDIGPMLAAQGYVVRTLLLPGHGTRPEDLMAVDLQDWQRLVQNQATIMRDEFSTVFLGGFSTGANLVTDYALQHGDIAGLLLFSPAFQANNSLVWLTPIIRPFRPWLRLPDTARPQQTTVRYLNIPTNGFTLFYHSSRNVLTHLTAAYDKPVFVVTIEHDSVLDTAKTLALFNRYLTHPASRLIWYGALPAGTVAGPRVMVKTDWLPQQRISQFSHMGILFSPDNPFYGAQAKEKMCWNGQSDAARRDCQDGKTVWYSDWGYQEPGKIYARLTFNPYWSWQNAAIAGFLRDATAGK